MSDNGKIQSNTSGLHDSRRNCQKNGSYRLHDIKNRLIVLDSPADVACALTEQAVTIKEKMEALSVSLQEIEALKAEVLQMQQVDFKKYADIIVNLQIKNELYWLIKHFDDNMLNDFRSRFDRDSARSIIEKYNRLLDEADRLAEEGILPGSEKAQRFAEAFWQMVTEFADGDLSMLPKLADLADLDGPDRKWQSRQATVHTFIEPALEAYFTASGYDPFAKDSNEPRHSK